MTPPVPLFRAWLGVGILVLAYIAAFIDRGVFALLIDPIKQDLQLSDVQISWLMGPAFGVMYSLLGIPVAWLADRYSRRTIIAIGMTLWSLMAAACGLSRDWLHLAVARIGVGVGEATLGPSAYSIIGDSFTRQKALRAIGIFTMGQSIGAGLAFLLGGEVIAFIQATPTISYPVLGELAAWQRAFIYFGLPGLLLVPLLYLIQEPPRVHSAADLMQASGLASHLWSNRGLLAPLFVGASITTVMGYALFWLPEVFRRVWHWDMDLIGWTYGGGLAVFGPLGVITGGRLAELLYARSSVAGPLMAVVIAVIGFLVFASIAPFMPTGSLSMMCYMPALFFLSMASATTSSAVLHIAPPAIRAQISASYLLTITILGVLFGPTSVAMITDYVFIDESKIHYALSIVSLLVGVLSLICLVSVRHRYRDEALKYEM